MPPEVYQVIGFIRNLSNLDHATMISVGYACYLYIVMDAPNHSHAKRRRR